ncbi:acyl-CoA thioesterase [Opitutaceae bacterium TAV4]|nr:acyl-CoA thioesterase [Opitutaceae bacterium TAV4]RRJ99376.1 acyl-CoA thioesterase [Opitutaceae bacterium TAV3]
MSLPSVTIEQKPAFCDFDPMGVVWHGNYFRYFEYAREALLDSIDYGYLRMEESGYLWPIVDTRVKYIAPVIFGRRILVTAAIAEYENRLRINYEICDAETGSRATRGHTLQIAVHKATRETCFVCPPVLFEKLGLPRP